MSLIQTSISARDESSLGIECPAGTFSTAEGAASIDTCTPCPAGVFTSEDDPILSDDEIAFLRDSFGERARIHPRGGHMGNLSSRNTVSAIQDFFSP